MVIDYSQKSSIKDGVNVSDRHRASYTNLINYPNNFRHGVDLEVRKLIGIRIVLLKTRLPRIRGNRALLDIVIS
jgi:hypothetical protein